MNTPDTFPEWFDGYTKGEAWIKGAPYALRRYRKVGTPDYIAGWEAACEEYMEARRENRTPTGVPIRTSYTQEAAYRSSLLAAPVS